MVCTTSTLASVLRQHQQQNSSAAVRVSGSSNNNNNSHNSNSDNLSSPRSLLLSPSDVWSLNLPMGTPAREMTGTCSRTGASQRGHTCCLDPGSTETTTTSARHRASNSIAAEPSSFVDATNRNNITAAAPQPITLRGGSARTSSQLGSSAAPHSLRAHLTGSRQTDSPNARLHQGQQPLLSPLQQQQPYPSSLGTSGRAQWGNIMAQDPNESSSTLDDDEAFRRETTATSAISAATLQQERQPLLAASTQNQQRLGSYWRPGGFACLERQLELERDRNCRQRRQLLRRVFRNRIPNQNSANLAEQTEDVMEEDDPLWTEGAHDAIGGFDRRRRNRGDEGARGARRRRRTDGSGAAPGDSDIPTFVFQTEPATGNSNDAAHVHGQGRGETVLECLLDVYANADHRPVDNHPSWSDDRLARPRATRRTLGELMAHLQEQSSGERGASAGRLSSLLARHWSSQGSSSLGSTDSPRSAQAVLNTFGLRGMGPNVRRAGPSGSNTASSNSLAGTLLGEDLSDVPALRSVGDPNSANHATIVSAMQRLERIQRRIAELYRRPGPNNLAPRAPHANSRNGASDMMQPTARAHLPSETSPFLRRLTETMSRELARDSGSLLQNLAMETSSLTGDSTVLSATQRTQRARPAVLRHDPVSLTDDALGLDSNGNTLPVAAFLTTGNSTSRHAHITARGGTRMELPHAVPVEMEMEGDDHLIIRTFPGELPRPRRIVEAVRARAQVHYPPPTTTTTMTQPERPSSRISIAEVDASSSMNELE